MTYDQIDRLLNAGFTPEQIMQLSSAPAGSSENPAPDPAGDEPPEVKPAETPAPDLEEKPARLPDPGPSPEPGILQEIKTGFEDLKKTIQANNIKTMSVNSLPGSADSAETVLAGIIRPPFDDRNNNIGGITK